MKKITVNKKRILTFTLAMMMILAIMPSLQGTTAQARQPHPFAIALEEFFSGSPRNSVAYIANVPGANGEVVLAARDLFTVRIFYMHDGVLRTHDVDDGIIAPNSARGARMMFFSDSNYLVSETFGYGGAGWFSVHYFVDGQLEMDKVTFPDTDDASKRQYGIQSAHQFRRPDDTAKILAMTIDGAPTPTPTPTPPVTANIFEDSLTNWPLRNNWTILGSWESDGANGITYTRPLPSWFESGLCETSLQLTGVSLGQRYTVEFEATGRRWNVVRFALGTDSAGNIVDDIMFTINWRGIRLNYTTELASFAFQTNRIYNVRVDVDGNSAEIYIDGNHVASCSVNNVVNPMFSFIGADCTVRNFRLTSNEGVAPPPSPIVNSHSPWATEELQEAAAMGLIPDSLINPSIDYTQPISRVEFAGIAVRTYEILANTTVLPAVTNPFTDTQSLDALKAFNAGIMVGTSATEFAPDVLLNRESCATALTRVFKRATMPGWTLATDADFPLTFTRPSTFADDADISTWARESVYFMVANGIIQGVGNNSFAPRAITSEQEAHGYAQATREQALIIAVRMINNLG